MGKHPPNRKPHCSTLEFYKEKNTLILVDIMEDVVYLVVRKSLGSAGPGSTDSEVLKEWLLKFGIIAETLFYCWSFSGLAGKSEPTLGRLSKIYIWPPDCIV